MSRFLYKRCVEPSLLKPRHHVAALQQLYTHRNINTTANIQRRAKRSHGSRSSPSSSSVLSNVSFLSASSSAASLSSARAFSTTPLSASSSSDTTDSSNLGANIASDGTSAASIPSSDPVSLSSSSSSSSTLSSSSPPSMDGFTLPAQSDIAIDDYPFFGIEWMTQFLQAIHETTGAPWWLSLVMGTVALRVAKSPLNYYQQIKMARLSYVNGYLHQLNEQFSAKPGYHKESLINEAGRQLRKLNKVYPRQVFYIPIADIGLFLTYAYTCRRLVTVDPELATGGLFWFKDLTLTDQTFLLPCMAAAISYASIEYSLIMSDMASRGAANHTAGNAALQPGDYNWELSAKLHTQMREEQDFQLKLNTYMAIMRMKVTYHMSRLQEYSQMAIILTFPIVASFPAGVFMYWIPNGLMQLGQIHALHHPAVKSFINERVDFKRVKLPEGLISTAELQNMQMREKRRYESENIDEVMATHQEKMRQRTLKDKERIQKLQHAREERENRDYAAEEMVKDAEVVEGKKDSDTAGSSNRKPLFYQDARSCPAQTRAQVSYKQSRRGKGGQKSSKSRANKTSRK